MPPFISARSKQIINHQNNIAMSVNQFAETVSKLQQLRPWEVPTNPIVHNHIVALYNQVHGEGGEAFAERESRYISRSIIDDSSKWAATPLSVFLAYVDLAVKNLTLEPGPQSLCYLLVRSVKVNVADNQGSIKEAWESRCYISITGYGEILLRQRAGQIRHCDTPVVVYHGDTFTYTEQDGRKHVSYGLNPEHDITRPIACFMKITRIDGTVDYAVMLPEAWARLGDYSLKQNARGLRDKTKAAPNALYTSGAGGSIDPGFLIAKCVKHAFKSYPKLPIGRGMIMEADIPVGEPDPEQYYNLSSPEKDPQPKTFAPEDPALQQGVTVDPAQDENSDDGTW